MLPQQRDDRLGLYISVPFCRSKCTYCNFASGVYPAADHALYVERLLAELRESRGWAANLGAQLVSTVDSIYFGGGTPVLLSPDLLRSIFAAIRDRFEVEAEAEITVECAPAQLSDEVLAAMADVGVNRVSLGVQSFVDREAALSGRLHTRTQVLRDIERLRAAGITNLNLDLLAGLGEQTIASWRESVEVLIETGVPHASIYMLEIDEESRLGRELIAGGARYSAGLVPNDDAIATMYEDAVAMLAGKGLEQYEISNFSKPGFESQHNLRYWRRRPYLGLGLDASSMLLGEEGSVLRATMVEGLREYLDGYAYKETSWLGPVQQLEEAWFLGLRRNEGVSVAQLEAEFGGSRIAASLAVVERLAGDGLLTREADQVCLTDRGRLLSNDVFGEFLGLTGRRLNACG